MIFRRSAILLIAIIAYVQCSEGSSGYRKLPRSQQQKIDSFRPQQSQIVTINRYNVDSSQAGGNNDASDAQKQQGIQDLHRAVSNVEDSVATPSTEMSHGYQRQNERMKNLLRVLTGRLDELDKQIIGTTLPLAALFAIMPISMALDLFWVNRLGNALAVAGQAAANQVYNSAFWLFSFLPSVTATLVSKSHSENDIEKTQDSVCQALIVALMISLVGTSFMFFRPLNALSSILKGR